jgi:glycosyltransferase involved in cell wall biosynthesis
LSDTAIAVTIPAFNAEATVGEVVRRALPLAAEVLVVDDGSTDATAKVAREAGARVARHDRNRGKGRALRTAFTDLFGGNHDAVATMDADGQHLPENLPRLVEALRPGADLVIGTRDHLFRDMYGVRRISNTWSSYLIATLAGVPLPDVQSGFRIYSRRLIETAGFPEPRFEAESAVVIRAARLGFRIVGVPIELGFADGRATSHYRPVIDSIRIALAVSRARLETVGCQMEHYS